MMKSLIKNKILKLVISLIVITLILLPVSNAGIEIEEKVTKLKTNASEILSRIKNFKSTQGTEFWALIFAVGVYYNNPEQNRESMLEAADNLYDVLVQSSNWYADHIHVVKASQATGKNLVAELNWLSNNADSDDMVVVYITTHGVPLKVNGLPLDLPPKDEADGADEALIMYHGFEYDYAFIWDDLLNFYLSRIESQGLCVIIDSCFAGGFNDETNINQINIENANSIYTVQSTNIEYTLSNNEKIVATEKNILKTQTSKSEENSITTESQENLNENNNNYNANQFTKEFTEDIAGINRIVLMSCQENQYSYGSQFSEFIISGFNGFADLFGNLDGINSAEESFAFADFWVNLLSGGGQDPTIIDDYPGDFLVTYA